MLGATMQPPRHQQSSEAMAEWFRDLFESDATRLSLSVLIILSVMPWFEVYALVFFAIFAVELFGRIAVLRDDLRQRSINRVEVLFLVLDIVATLSFLPIEVLWDDIRFLRLIRLSRMLLLVGYWGPVAREIWTILMKRERRYQIFFIVASVAILSFITAVLLYHFKGKAGDPAQFWTFLWWSFRQIEDPGNMVQDPRATLAFFCSVFLTLSGLFLFSFLIGIATSVVEELVKVGRERRIGLRRHSVICNISPHTRVLLEELVTYYAKSLRSPKIITMGPAESRYNYMYEERLRRIRYRQGQALSTHDLQKVDADRARRVILLGNRDREASDSEVVSQILSVREVNPDCNIYAEIYRRDNVGAAQRAGGPRTVTVLADQLVNLFLAKIVAFPGVEPIYTELLTSKGEEIYTCVYDYGAMENQRRPSGTLLPFGELMERCHRAHGVILLGHLLADERGPTGFIHSLNPGGRRHPDQPARPIIPDVSSLRGFFGVASNFTRLREFVDSLPDVSAARPGQGQGERGGPVPGFGVCPVAAGLSRLLICGFHDGLIDCCEQLILFCDELEVFVMIPDDSHVDSVVETFVERMEDGGIPGLEHRVSFTRGAGRGAIDYVEEEHPERRGRIQVITGDWAHESTMLEHAASGYRLTEMDAVLFTYSLGEPDPDARTALGLIKLINLKETYPERIRADLRIVCEVQNTEKAALFQRRFGRRSPEASSPCHPVSIVAAESMRNALMAQAIFVPGIDTIYRELLSEEGEEVCKLLVSDPVDPGMRLSFGQLLATLYQRDDLLLLAVELEDPQEGRRLVVNPRHGSPDYAFTAGDLVSIFAIGEYSSMPRATEACPACFSSAEASGDGDHDEGHDEDPQTDDTDDTDDTDETGKRDDAT
jgi:hypothetical protein